MFHWSNRKPTLKNTNIGILLSPVGNCPAVFFYNSANYCLAKITYIVDHDKMELLKYYKV